MKLKNYFAFLAWAVAAANVLNACAGPAQRADLAANPSWVAHLDFDALKPTTIGSYVMDQLATPEAQRKLAGFQAICNFDPRSALHGVSIYNVSDAKAEAVVVVYADVDAERLTTLAKGGAEYQGSEHQSHAIHSWVDKGRRSFGSIAGKRVLLSQNKESLAAALDVLDGVSGNLASSRAFAQIGTTTSGKFLQVAGKKLPENGNPAGALLKLADEMRLELGESDGRVNGSVQLQARDQEVAGHMRSIAEGLVALMKLSKDKPGQARLADAMSLGQEGSAVVATVSLPASEVVTALRHHEEKKKAGKSL